MTRIARKLKADKRTKRRISVLPEKTQAILYFDQITLKMKLPEAKRIVKELSLAVEIIEDRKARPKREELRII
jgi:hypothetical protein